MGHALLFINTLLLGYLIKSKLLVSLALVTLWLILLLEYAGALALETWCLMINSTTVSNHNFKILTIYLD